MRGASDSLTSIDSEFLARLACPACHGPLQKRGESLACNVCQCAYPVVDGIPVLIAERAVACETIE